jgi:formate hydrogenlyase subunit 4
MAILLHLALILVAPPLLAGLVAKTKALLTGRRGAPLLQPYFDLAKLVRKGAVYSRTTTWVFRVSPVVALGSTLVAALLVPLGPLPAPLAFWGDLILFGYLLALGRYFMVLAALDTGSSFEGMAASREASFSALAEPALFLGLVVLGLNAASLSLTESMWAVSPAAWKSLGPAPLLVLMSLFVVLLAENARVPVDDPATHLELTMIHEGLILDHSGPDLAYLVYASHLKLFLFATLVGKLALPFGMGRGWEGVAITLAGIALVGVVVGIVESTTARVRLARVPLLLVAAVVLAVVGLAIFLTWGALRPA